MLRPEQNNCLVKEEEGIVENINLLKKQALTDRPHVANSFFNSLVKSYCLVSPCYQNKNLLGIHDSPNTYSQGLCGRFREIVIN